MLVDRRPNICIQENISYLKTPSSPNTTKNNSEFENNRATQQGVAPSNPNYSDLGPAYETINSRRPQEERNQAPISERYEIAEIHTSDETGNRPSEYEVPRQSIVKDDYSHLQR